MSRGKYLAREGPGSRLHVAFLPPRPKKKRTILVMHHVVSKNLRPDFAAMHRCVKSRQSQVAFASGSAAESSSMIPRYHKILILCINSLHGSFFFFFVQGCIFSSYEEQNGWRASSLTIIFKRSPYVDVGFPVTYSFMLS